MIKGAFTTNEQKDTKGNHYVAQVESNFLTTNAAVYYPYGYYANTPIDSFAIMLNMQAQQEDQFILPYDPATRFTGLEPYEVMVGNQQQKIYIKFLNNGNVEILANETALVTCKNSVINCTENSTVNCVDSTITCSGNSTVDCVDSTITCSGDSSIDCVNSAVTCSGTAAIDASPTITLTATTTAVMGDLMVSGSINGGSGFVASGGNVSTSGNVSDGAGSMANDRTKYNSHVHTNPEGGNVGPAVPQQP